MGKAKYAEIAFALIIVVLFSGTADGQVGHVDGRAAEAVSTPVVAEGTAKPKPAEFPLQLSLTTSGGVSLGGYQAGYLYYLSETVKHNPALFAPRVVTGSSAGTINSMILALSLGRDFSPSPSETLFFKAWTDLHYRDLIDVKEAPPLAISSRKALEAMAIQMEKAWSEGLDDDLDIVLGVTVTRVKTREVPLNENFSVPRQEEKFIFRIQGRGPGKDPLVSNYVDVNHGIEHPLLPFVGPEVEGSSRINFKILKDLMFASSAFPLAFPAQELSFCMTRARQEGGAEPLQSDSCVSPEYREEFVDGSMFDRNPLGLAFRIARSGLTRDEDHRVIWHDTPGVDQEAFDDFIMLYLDALHVSYPSYEGAKVSTRVKALFPAFGAYSQGYVRSAQAKEMYTLLDEHPEIRDRVGMTAREYPSASGLLANFFGFFDREFRVFDFYLGMHDAHRYLETRVAETLKTLAGHGVDIHFPEKYVDFNMDGDWSPYYCMQAVLDEKPEFYPACRAKGIEEFTTLLQVSLIRMYDQCSTLRIDETIDHPHCIRGMKGRRPPMIKKMSEEDFVQTWEREGDESEFQYTMRLLESYDFWFRDLDLDKDQSWLAMSRMREELAGALDAYAKKLPAAESLSLRILGKPALNLFYYQPPQTIIYAGAGKGAEVGLSLSGRYAPARWLRFNFALGMKGLNELLSPAEDAFSIAPLMGFEFENLRWSSMLLQARLGVRVGYQFSTADDFLTSTCDVEKFQQDSRMCSAPVGQVFLALIFFDRIRLQGGLEWFPYFLPPMNEKGENIWNGFIEIGWQWISPF